MAKTVANIGGNISVQTNATGPFALIEFTGALPRAKLYNNWEVITDDAHVRFQRAFRAQRDTGQIEHRKSRVTVIEQEINERRCPAADVDDAGILAYARRGDERQRQVGAALTPTDILRAFGLVHLIPMFLTIHLVSSIPLRAWRFTRQKNQNVHLQ